MGSSACSLALGGKAGLQEVSHGLQLLWACLVACSKVWSRPEPPVNTQTSRACLPAIGDCQHDPAVALCTMLLSTMLL
jgi:hypothetical protein